MRGRARTESHRRRYEKCSGPAVPLRPGLKVKDRAEPVKNVVKAAQGFARLFQVLWESAVGADFHSTSFFIRPVPVLVVLPVLFEISFQVATRFPALGPEAILPRTAEA